MNIPYKARVVQVRQIGPKEERRVLWYASDE